MTVKIDSMFSPLTSPVADLVRQYASDLAIVHRVLLDTTEDVAAGLSKINKSDAGDHPGHVLSPVVRRHAGPLLLADLEGANLSCSVGNFDSLRLRFLEEGHSVVAARVRKRKARVRLVPEDSWPASLMPGMRPGCLTVLWELRDDQLREVVLAWVNEQSLDEDVLVIYEEAPLPAPAPRRHPAPPGSSNEDDDLGGVVKSKDDKPRGEDMDSA